jgi:succinate dehydrogenase / fumarate reductase, cytochrome b subunit
MANAAIKKARPKYLSLAALLFEIRLPLAGWVSILHRVSGALLFLATVWLLFLLDRSLASESGFESVQRYTSLPIVKAALLVLIWSYCHHFCAGIRFLFLDIHKGIDKDTARLTSIVVIVAGLGLAALFGARLL